MDTQATVSKCLLKFQKDLSSAVFFTSPTFSLQQMYLGDIKSNNLMNIGTESAKAAVGREELRVPYRLSPQKKGIMV